MVQTATAIHQLNLATGAVVTTSTPELVQFSSFVAGTGWVIFKTSAITDGRLQALDTRTGKINSYDPVPGQQLLHLIVAGHPSN